MVELIMMEKDPSTVLHYSGHIQNTALKLENGHSKQVDYARNAQVLVKVEKLRLKDLSTWLLPSFPFGLKRQNNYLNLVPTILPSLTDMAAAHRVRAS
jgi:hypothetical protein